MKPAIFHREAEAELDAAIAHYEGQRDGLGQEFQEAIEQGVARIVEMPQAFPCYGHEGTRRFPYSIFFRELEDAIWIAAVAHAKRRPDYWIHRVAE